MSDKKNEIVSLDKMSARERMLQKLAAKNTPGIEKPKKSAVDRVKTSGNKKTASRLVICSTHPNKGYIFSMRVENDIAYIHSRELTEVTNKRGSGAAGEELRASTVVYENETEVCKSCSNKDGWFICKCGTVSCLSKSKTHKCPNCQAKNSPKDMITAPWIDASAGSDRKGKSSAALPKRGSGLFIGFKR